MKNYRYNLDTLQAKHFAGLKKGETMTIIIPLSEQPPDDYSYFAIEDEIIEFTKKTDMFFGEWHDKLPYPVGARVGLRETWESYGFDCNNNLMSEYKKRKRSAQSMPVEAIRYWGIVKETRVDRIKRVKVVDWLHAGFFAANWDISGKGLLVIGDWFNARYGKTRLKHPVTWAQNVYVEIFVVEK